MATKNRVIPHGKRSDNRATLVLLGLTGAGKTTTLNFLFGEKNITKTESYCSATSTIMEYSAKIPYDGDEYDLRVIDTPGFGDTRQQPHVRDARFVATFNQLLTNHEDLKSCYPTTVLLVAKFNDDRIDGETSHFIQMLKAVDTLLSNYRLIDKGSCNLIFVLTHVMSEDNEDLRKDPGPKVQLIESLVRTFTKIPTPIEVVMAENKPELYKLAQRNEYYKLPNGQYYPLNLFQKIQSVAVKCQDVVGETIIREAFKNPADIKIELHQESELLPGGNLLVNQVMKVLKEAKFNIENTYISRTLKAKWDALDEKLKQPYFNSLQIAQMTFNRQKIFGEADLPKTPEDVLKLLVELPLNPALVTVLESMGITGPELPKSLGAGSFYNIFTDSIMTNSPFNMDSLEFTDIGYRAPRGIRATVISESVRLNSIFETQAEYYQERMKQLEVYEQFNTVNFSSELKNGSNVIPKGHQHKAARLTGVREHRIFMVHLKHPTLSAGFKKIVSGLPKTFNAGNGSQWASFFRANGTHIVETLYAGGSIDVVAMRRSGMEAITSSDKVLDIISEILTNIGIHRPINLEAAAEDWEFKINFRGGDPNIIRPTLANIFTPNGVAFFKKWTESLFAHPAMLDSEIGLESIVFFVEQQDFPIAQAMSQAMTALFGKETNKDEPPPPLPPKANGSPVTEAIVPSPTKLNESVNAIPTAMVIPKAKLQERRGSTPSPVPARHAKAKKAVPSKRAEVQQPRNPNPNSPESWSNWFKRKVRN